MTDEQKLKEIYLMDRAIRALNSEDGLYNYGWLYNLEDGITDNGFESFKGLDSQNFESYAENYDHLKQLYKQIMDDCYNDGILSSDYFADKQGYKWNAGANSEVINFVKKDYPDINVIGQNKITESSDDKCCICGQPLSYYGNNNAEPVCEGRCCDSCNDSVVVPYRIYLAYGGTPLNSIEDIKKITSQISL